MGIQIIEMNIKIIYVQYKIFYINKMEEQEKY